MSDHTARGDAALVEATGKCQCPACSSPFIASPARAHHRVKDCAVYCGEDCDCELRPPRASDSITILQGARAC